MTVIQSNDSASEKVLKGAPAAVEAYVTHSLPDFISEFHPITEAGTLLNENIVAVAGSVQSIRRHSDRRVFYDIYGDGAKLQLTAFVKDFAACATAFDEFNNTIEEGNLIGARGYAGRSKAGCLSLSPFELVLLSPRKDPLLKVIAAGGSSNIQKQKTSAAKEQKANPTPENAKKKNRRRKKQELKVNSRASLWASGEEEKKKKAAEILAQKQLKNKETKKYSSNGGRTSYKNKRNGKLCENQEEGIRNDDNAHATTGRGGSQATAREAWAAARAQIEQSEKEKGNVNSAFKSHGESDLYISAKCLSSDSTKKVSVSDPSEPFRPKPCPKRIIRDEWEKMEIGHVKSKLEEDMEVLYQCINDSDIGMLSSTRANLAIELSDEKGGSINTTQDQILAEAAAKMMEEWRDHKKWTKDEARLAGQILLRMEKEEVLGEGEAVRKQDYLAVINAYAKVTTEDKTASIRAENLLDHMERRTSEGRSDLVPDRLTINTVMGAQAKHSLSGKLSANSVLAAERMLATLERAYAQGDDTMQPTARTYSKFIDLYAKNGQSDKAVRTLDRMEQQYRDFGNKAALPTTIHYTSVIDALAKTASSSRDAARTAEEILRSMLDLYDKGERQCAPDFVVFSATIDAFAKSGRRDAAERSLAILDLMDEYQVDPDIITYNTLLNTLSNSPDYQYFSTSKDILNFIEQSSHLRADSFTYNAVIKSSPPEEIENLIQHWEMEYKSGRTDERPDSYTYNSLIKAWTASNTIGAEEKCMEILHWMEDNQVIGMDRIVYNEVMKAYGRSCRDDAGDMAQRVFNRLITRYERTRDKRYRPDKYSYMNLLNAHSRSCKTHEAAAKAEYVLFDMMDSNILPDGKLCSTVISAWARSGSDAAIMRAEEVCNRMDAQYIEMDIVCFNCLINVYAKSNNPEKSVRAFKVLDRMEDRRITPNSVTYTSLFEACQDDDEYVMKVFESCIQDGMLDEKLQYNMVENGPVCIKERLSADIPYEWSRNANRGHGGKSRNQLKWDRKEDSTGADLRKFCWAR